MPSDSNPFAEKPSDLVDPDKPSKHDRSKSGKPLLIGSLALVGLIGAWEVAYHVGWLWPILLGILVTAGWLLPALCGDYLVGQGRYDEALKLVAVLAISGLGRSRRRADVLTEAGRYEEAERILREIIDHEAGGKATNAEKIKVCFDLENLGNVLMETGRFEEAQRCFRNAGRMYPYHSAWATGMAEVFLRQSIFPEKALADVEKALNLFQRGAERVSSSSRLGAILATKAWALAACGHEVEAQKVIDSALKSPARKAKGSLAQIHFKAGKSLLTLSDTRGAEQHFTSGAELDPVGRWGRLCADALRREK